METSKGGANVMLIMREKNCIKKTKLPAPSGFVVVEPFFEPSLLSGFFCTLGFFLDPKRSASISSMSWAEANRGQWKEDHSAELCPGLPLLSVLPSCSSVCRQDLLQIHQSPLV